jgi:hypothetical protein
MTSPLGLLSCIRTSTSSRTVAGREVGCSESFVPGFEAKGGPLADPGERMGPSPARVRHDLWCQVTCSGCCLRLLHRFPSEISWPFSGTAFVDQATAAIRLMTTARAALRMPTSASLCCSGHDRGWGGRVACARQIRERVGPSTTLLSLPQTAFGRRPSRPRIHPTARARLVACQDAQLSGRSATVTVGSVDL